MPENVEVLLFGLSLFVISVIILLKFEGWF